MLKLIRFDIDYYYYGSIIAVDTDNEVSFIVLKENMNDATISSILILVGDTVITHNLAQTVYCIETLSNFDKTDENKYFKKTQQNGVKYLHVKNVSRQSDKKNVHLTKDDARSISRQFNMLLPSYMVTSRLLLNEFRFDEKSLIEVLTVLTLNRKEYGNIYARLRYGSYFNDEENRNSKYLIEEVYINMLEEKKLLIFNTNNTLTLNIANKENKPSKFKYTVYSKFIDVLYETLSVFFWNRSSKIFHSKIKTTYLATMIVLLKKVSEINLNQNEVTKATKMIETINIMNSDNEELEIFVTNILLKNEQFLYIADLIDDAIQYRSQEYIQIS
jgi:hypothetical protein